MLHSAGQSKSQGHPRFKALGNIHFLLGGAERPVEKCRNKLRNNAAVGNDTSSEYNINDGWPLLGLDLGKEWQIMD